jgi:hypothetical protein
MNSIYYHEDDHSMKLIIPEENLPFIWYEFEEFIGYDIEQKVDTNAPEIFSLDKLKIKLIERNIPVSDFEALCQSLGFERIDEIYTGYSTYRELDKKSKAFSLCDQQQKFENFTLFYETEGTFISYLWVLDYFYRHDSIVELLNELGKKWNLCLAENGGKAVNLSEEECIHQYFDEKP